MVGELHFIQFVPWRHGSIATYQLSDPELAEEKVEDRVVVDGFTRFGGRRCVAYVQQPRDTSYPLNHRATELLREQVPDAGEVRGIVMIISGDDDFMNATGLLEQA